MPSVLSAHKQRKEAGRGKSTVKKQKRWRSIPGKCDDFPKYAVQFIVIL
jgi:hypothetical protein